MEITKDMEHIKVYELTSDGSGREIMCSDKESVRNFIGNAAFTSNHGVYRHWKMDGRNYYDCGPIVYYTNIPIDLEMPGSKEDLGTKK